MEKLIKILGLACFVLALGSTSLVHVHNEQCKNQEGRCVSEIEPLHEYRPGPLG
ncbi:MAG: hypothetical protein KHY88_08815 [Erysipelotrichaceae bacterium]|nr:hypothetical protein [Erysipelotrichaceae bacterium]